MKFLLILFKKNSIKCQNFKNNQSPLSELQYTKKLNIQRSIICFMLYHQHLKPWLLIYLLASCFLFLSTLGIMVMILINDINGFTFAMTPFSTCSTYVNFKLNIAMETALKVSFIMTLFSILFSIGQCAVGAWQFFLFSKWCQENDQNSEKPFESLSKKILILLYLLNTIGFFTLIPIIGWFGTLFIDLGECKGTQNKSNSYSIPSAVAGSALIFQLCSFIFLLKLLYCFYQDEDDYCSQKDYNELRKRKVKGDFETPQARKERRMKEKIELEQIKKRILASKNQQYQLTKQMGNQPYKSNTTNGSPTFVQDKLLNKTNPEDHIFGQHNEFRAGLNNSFDRKELRKSLKKNKIINQSNRYDLSPKSFDGNASGLPFNKETLNQFQNSQNQLSRSNYNNGKNLQINNVDYSQSQIAEQQRNLLKKIPKNKNNTNLKNKKDLNGVIFQDPDQENLNQISVPDIRKRPKPTERLISDQEQKKSQNQIKKLKNLVQSISLKTSKSEDTYIFKTKYNHYMYLMKKEKKVVSNSLRRSIKRPLLGIRSKVVEFDSKNYQIQDIAVKIQPNDQSPYKSNNSNSQKQLESDTKLQIVGQNNPSSKPQEAQVMNEINLQINPQTVSKNKSLKSAAQILRREYINGLKAQNYNPIKNYVDEGQDYEYKLQKILEFEQIGIKKKTDEYDPFEAIPNKQKTAQTKQKLYLHKNKHRMGRYQDNEALEEYGDRVDPFKDMAFEDDWNVQRGFMKEDSSSGQNGGKGGQKGFIDSLLGTGTQPRRINRKQGGLVELIRGKHPISFL